MNTEKLMENAPGSWDDVWRAEEAAKAREAAAEQRREAAAVRDRDLAAAARAEEFKQHIFDTCVAMNKVAAMEYATPAPNAAEHATAAKVERRNAATSRPWQIRSDYEPFSIIGDIDGPDDGHYHYVPVCSTDSDDANPEGVDGANARHIVRAVNAHDDLVKFAQEFLRLMGGDADSTNPLDVLARRGLAKAAA